MCFSHASVVCQCTWLVRIVECSPRRREKPSCLVGVVCAATDQFLTLVVPSVVSKISFSVPDHIGMSVSSHISFIAVGLAHVDFTLLLAPGPSVAHLHFPA